jgi:hypothetical protein
MKNELRDTLNYIEELKQFYYFINSNSDWVEIKVKKHCYSWSEEIFTIKKSMKFDNKIVLDILKKIINEKEEQVNKILKGDKNEK